MTDEELDALVYDLSHTGNLSMLYRSMIADAITTLRAERDDARARIAAMESGDWSEVKLVRFENGQMDITAGPIPAIAEYLAQMMQDGEGKYFNYMEVSIGHKTAGPMTLSLQRKNGKTPNQLRKEAEARADSAEAALKLFQSLDAISVAKVEELQAALARAEAAPAAQIEADGWQPIETAPKHGVMVDLWCRAFHGRDCRVTDMWWTDRTGWRNGKNDAYAGSMAERATHWRSPPQDPTVAQPHDRTALDAMLQAEREKALRDAADAVMLKTYGPHAPKDFRDGYDVAKADVATAIFALIPREIGSGDKT